MPPALIEAFDDHGEVRGDTILEGLDEAKRVLQAFEEAGIAYDDVITTIEREGVEKFAKSFEELIEGLQSKLKSLVAV
jgi:transaldolase